MERHVFEDPLDATFEAGPLLDILLANDGVCHAAAVDRVVSEPSRLMPLLLFLAVLFVIFLGWALYESS